MAQFEIEALLEPALAPGTRTRLARYGELVLEANLRFNLTGAKTAAEIAGHIRDSLTVLEHVREPYVDVGSGGGFPAVPVAIVAGIPVTLIEASAKKARFLQRALEELGLRGQVIAERVEIAAHRADLRERFATGTARALGSAPTVAELLLPLIAVGGTAVLQRGASSPEEFRALEDAVLMLGAGVEARIALDGRQLILLRKQAATPRRFPRRPGVPAKRPLCLEALQKRSP